MRTNRPLAAALLACTAAFPSAHAAAVAPTVAAEQLMNFGETTFKTYFPEHQPTQTFGPFRFRAYSSKVLLGVVVSADPQYTLNGVYVMGGPFGNQPQYVGQLTQFITPTEPGPGPTEPNNGCFDMNLLTSSGYGISVTYDLTGPRTGSLMIDTYYSGLAAFQGQTYNESSYREHGTVFDNNLPVAIDNSEKRYVRQTGVGELTHYGTSASAVTNNPDYIATTTFTTVYSPPWQDRIYALAQGQSLTSSWTNMTTRVTTYSTPNLPTTTNTYGASLSETVTFIGRERVTVHAGDYDTCHFERVNSATGETTNEWVIAGKGVLIKSVNVKGSSTQTMEARTATLNTDPL